MDGQGPPSIPPTLFSSLNRRPRAPDNSKLEAKETRDAAAREARRLLLQVVRTDWTFDPATPPSAAQSPPELANVEEWRLRAEDSSCSEHDGEKIAHGTPESRSTATVVDPYRFESPEAVEDSMQERRRKRRKVVEDEMEWNYGLRVWMRRRDVWTGATVPTRKAEEVEVLKARTSSEESRDGSGDSGEDAETTESSSRPLSTSSENVLGSVTELSTQPSQDSKTGIVVPTKQPSSLTSDEPLIPVVRPVLPSADLFRNSITPAVYHTIYSRLVVQSHAPAVPINLSHMTRALVQGWKAEGQWPPKPTMTREIPVTRKQASNKQKATQEPTHRRRSIGSGVSGAVKKVLGFASIPGRGFHIRGNSQSGGKSPPLETGEEADKGAKGKS